MMAAETMGEQILLDVVGPAAARQWRVITDAVMGGVSEAELVSTGAGAVEFLGALSLEHRGGFASVRSHPGRFDLSAWEGIALYVKGDGNQYRLTLTTAGNGDGVTYQAGFPTDKAAGRVVRIPFSEFAPTFHGRPVPDAPPLDPARISTIGFLVADRQEGRFRLELRAIKAYRRA